MAPVKSRKQTAAGAAQSAAVASSTVAGRAAAVGAQNGSTAARRATSGKTVSPLLTGQVPGSCLYRHPGGPAASAAAYAAGQRPPKGRANSYTYRYYLFNNHPGGVYTRPVNPYMRGPVFRPVPAKDFRGRKLMSRVVETGLVVPAICPRPGCGETDFQTKVEYQAHLDLHEHRFVCPEDKCRKSNGIFDTEALLEKHAWEQHHPESTKLPLDNIWCYICNHHITKKADLPKHFNRRHPGAPVPTTRWQEHGGRD